MFRNIPLTIRALFENGAEPTRLLAFSWRLLKRHGRPFLLVPEHEAGISSSVELYSAQRPLAKLSRFLIPIIFRTPFAGLFPRLTLQVDADSDWIRFLAEQAGQRAEELQAPAIMFSGLAENRGRVLLLLCDAGGYPIRILKIGLHPQSRATTEQEGDFLSKLPQDLVGCTGLTGRFSNGKLSAFSTAFFAGKSLGTDVGIERLFHAWLNPGPPVPIETLASWKELESAAAAENLAQWQVIHEALARKSVRSTLFHGDFAPWNVRMMNLETIRAYDWESGRLEGLPAWDWFHFIVQTSHLVKRHSPERVVAELEQVVRSARFQEYARSAGITNLIEPLALAYLLHKRLVLRPPGSEAFLSRLFDLIWTHWEWGQRTAVRRGMPVLRSPKSSPVRQLKAAFRDLANLLWEPVLSPVPRPSLGKQIAGHWKLVAGSLLWSMGVFAVSVVTDPHLLFAPLYLLPCMLLAVKVDRRAAGSLAYLAAIGPPLVGHWFRPDVASLAIVLWNAVMRVLVFQLVVILFDRIRTQSLHQELIRSGAESSRGPSLAANWPSMLIATGFLSGVMGLDAVTDPGLILMPLYLLPCMTLTLAMGWRWGSAAAVLSSIVGPLLQRLDPGYAPAGIEFWNMLSRFLIFEAVVIVLEPIRRGSILFKSRLEHFETLPVPALAQMENSEAVSEPATR